MGMRMSSVRGTPINHINATGGQGQRSDRQGSVKGDRAQEYNGTVNRQFEGDQTGNEQVRRNGNLGKMGTPMQSQAGNPPGARREAEGGGRYGKVISNQEGDQALSDSNGNGVILDGMSREEDYYPLDRRADDSPVPDGAPTFRRGSMRAENIAHIGEGVGASPSQSGDDILAIGGVISRGMDADENEVDEGKMESTRPESMRTTAEAQQQHDEDRG